MLKKVFLVWGIRVKGGHGIEIGLASLAWHSEDCHLKNKTSLLCRDRNEEELHL